MIKIIKPQKRYLFKPSFLAVFFIVIAMILISLAIISAGWYMDITPPVLHLNGVRDDGIYGNVLNFMIVVSDKKNNIAQLIVKIDQNIIFKKTYFRKNIIENISLDTTKDKQGKHNLEVLVEDTAIWRNTLNRGINYSIDHESPDIDVKLLPASVQQGNTLALYVTASEALSQMEGKLDNKDIRFYAIAPESGCYRALTGITAWEKAGKHQLIITAFDIAGNEQVVSADVTVLKKNFTRDVIILPKNKSGLLTDTEGIKQDVKMTNNAIKEHTTQKLWQSLWLNPTQGWITSEFGARRVFNNGAAYDIHLGIDICNKEGTRILAANSGTVVLAETLPIHGTTVIIDHGQGVFSLYAHLNKILVQRGELVVKGQLIALMGKTGKATGPHLHWSIIVNGVYVNPQEWVTRSFE